MPPRRRGREASAADRALFLAAVGEARPTGGDDAGPSGGAPAPRRAAPPPPPVDAAPPALAPGAATGGDARAVLRLRRGQTRPQGPAGPRRHPRAGGVDARAVLRLRRGQTRPQARLDLHGHTLEQAHRAVVQFVERAASDGRRCVLVITGKGSIGQAAATIRGEFPRWLNQARLRPRILAFAEAQPRDGGAGAFYVLLKKRRG